MSLSHTNISRRWYALPPSNDCDLKVLLISSMNIKNNHIYSILTLSGWCHRLSINWRIMQSSVLRTPHSEATPGGLTALLGCCTVMSSFADTKPSVCFLFVILCWTVLPISHSQVLPPRNCRSIHCSSIHANPEWNNPRSVPLVYSICVAIVALHHLYYSLWFSAVRWDRQNWTNRRISPDCGEGLPRDGWSWARGCCTAAFSFIYQVFYPGSLTRGSC